MKQFINDQPVLNSDFGFKVRAKLDKMNGDSQNSLDSVYGEFAEVFLQSLDFKTVSSTQGIDLTQSEGFESLIGFEWVLAKGQTRGKYLDEYFISRKRRRCIEDWLWIYWLMHLTLCEGKILIEDSLFLSTEFVTPNSNFCSRVLLANCAPGSRNQ